MTAVEALLAEATDLDEQAQALKERARDLRRQADDAARATRPAYPTREQRIGIDVAIERWRAGYVPKSHHGDPAGPPPRPYSVTGGVLRGAGWVSIRHGAPLAYSGGGGRLWNFTDDEVEAILETVARHGVGIIEHWTHDEGLSVRIKELP